MTVEQIEQMEALKAELRAANAYGRQLRKHMAELDKAKSKTPKESIEQENSTESAEEN